MDFGFSPEQEMLRASVQKLLAAACPSSLVRTLAASDDAYDPALWQELADLGVLGILIPAEDGGQGGSFLDLVVALEEMGKALLPGPLFATAVLGAPAVVLGGTPEQRRDLLPAVAAGTRRMTLAVGEERGDGAGAVTLPAVASADGYRLRGTKAFVMDAHVADTLVVAARTGGERETGVTLFAIDAHAEGVAIAPLRTVDMTRRLCTVRLDVAVPAAAVVGPLGGGWPIVRRVVRQAQAALAVEAIGTAQRALDMAVAYANVRQQFGRPIGSFQAVKHKCVDMMVAVETARSLAYYAAWAVTADADDVDAAVAMAKAYASDVAKTVTSEAIQVHGGIGFTWEHDIHLYHRRALASAAAFGSAVEHRETVARAVLS